MDKEVEFLPLIKASRGHMASRRILHEYGVTDAMIDASEGRGEVIVSGTGEWASIIITDAGLALYP